MIDKIGDSMKKVITRGFSLLELVIVVAIVAFLSMIALPSYTRFMARAKRTEAYANLNTIYAAQKAYWAERGTYTTQLLGTDGLGWKPEGSCTYTYGFPGTQGVNYIVGRGGDVSGLSSARADQNSFLVIATADIDGDGTFDVIGMDQDHNVKIIQDDLA